MRPVLFPASRSTHALMPAMHLVLPVIALVMQVVNTLQLNLR